MSPWVNTHHQQYWAAVMKTLQIYENSADRERGKKKASNAAKISSMERTHCTRVLSFILSLPFSLLLHSPTNLQSKHLHPALFMYIFLHVSNLLDLDNEFLLATSALVFTRHPFPVALQGLSSADWWLMESHGRRSKASNPQSPHGGVGVRQTHEHACEVTDGWCVETSTPLSLAATLPNTSQASWWWMFGSLRWSFGISALFLTSISWSVVYPCKDKLSKRKKITVLILATHKKELHFFDSGQHNNAHFRWALIRK